MMSKKLLLFATFLTLCSIVSAKIDKNLDYYLMDIRDDGRLYYSDDTFPETFFGKFKYRFFIDPYAKSLFSYSSHDSYFKPTYDYNDRMRTSSYSSLTRKNFKRIDNNIYSYSSRIRTYRGVQISSPVFFAFEPIKDKPTLPSDIKIENIKIESNVNNYDLQNVLFGNSKVDITFNVKNYGRAPAYAVLVKISTSDKTNDISYNPYYMITQPIDPGYSHKVKIPVSSVMAAKHKDYSFKITTKEFFGFDASPESFLLKVRKVPNPKFSRVSTTIDDDDVGLSYGNSDERIQKGESIEFTVKIKNTGTLSAKSVHATFSLEEEVNGMFLPEDQVLEHRISEFGVGDEMDLYVYFYTSKVNDINNIPLQLIIKESTGEFAEIFKFDLPISN